MVQKIVKGKHIFARKAQPATEADKQVVTDLIDTLRANRETCVGMAANMIHCSGGRSVPVCNGKSRYNPKVRRV